MKQGLQGLLIAPDRKMRDAIHRGIKAITIREGHRDHKPGPALIACHIEPWAVMADITSVRHCTLREVTKEEYKADGFNSKVELLNGMRKFYPNMNLDSPVTVIRWTNVHGYWVDHKEEYLVDG